MVNSEELRQIAASIQTIYPYQATRLRMIADELDRPLIRYSNEAP